MTAPTERTPGEWYAEYSEVRQRWDVNACDPFGGGEDGWLAELGEDTGCTEADAYLMAAAPELYAIVSEMWGDAYETRTIGSFRVGIEPEMVARIEAALAKAEGREA